MFWYEHLKILFEYAEFAEKFDQQYCFYLALSNLPETTILK